MDLRDEIKISRHSAEYLRLGALGLEQVLGAIDLPLLAIRHWADKLDEHASKLESEHERAVRND